MVSPICASGIFQKDGDRASLIVRGNRRMPPLADRHAENALPQIGQLPGIEQPFEKIGRTQMNDRNARPVQYLLGDKAVAARVAGREAIGRALRLVDDR